MVKQDTRSTKYYIGCAVAIFVMFFFGKIVKPWGSVTEVGVCVLGVFLGVIIAIFVTGDTLWPSVVAMTALTVGGYFPNFNAAIGGVFGLNVVFGCFLITAIVNGMNDLGTGEAIASILLTRKAFQRKPLLLSYCFLAIFAISINFMNTTGTLLVGYPILDAMLRTAKIKPTDKYAKFMNFGLFLAIALGFTFRSVVMPEVNFRFQYFTDALAGTNVQMHYGLYTGFILVNCFTFFALYVLAMKYIFKCDFAGLKDLDFTEMPEIVSKAKMNKYQVTFIVAFLMFAFSGLAPASWKFIKSIGQYGVLCLICVLLFFMKRKDENGSKYMLFDFGKYLKTVPWTVALSLGIFSAVGTALASDAAGFKEWLVEAAGSALAGSGSISLVLIVIIGTCVLTQVFNNAATMTIFAALVAPLVVPYAVEGSLDSSLLLACIVMGAQSGSLTMAASGTAPIMHTREGLDSKFILTSGLFMEFIFVVLTILMYFLFVAIF